MTFLLQIEHIPLNEIDDFWWNQFRVQPYAWLQALSSLRDYDDLNLMVSMKEIGGLLSAFPEPKDSTIAIDLIDVYRQGISDKVGVVVRVKMSLFLGFYFGRVEIF